MFPDNLKPQAGDYFTTGKAFRRDILFISADGKHDFMVAEASWIEYTQPLVDILNVHFGLSEPTKEQRT